MRCIWLAFYFCSTIVLLTGCWGRTEINDLAIVTAAAFDKGDNNQIELTLEVFVPRTISGGGGSAGGGSSGGGGNEVTTLKSGTGVNIADATSKIQGKISRRIFWGHCKVFIIGEALAKSGIQQHVDFLLRHPEIRGRAYLYVSKGRSASVLQENPFIERYPAEVIRELSDLQIGMKITLQQVNQMLMAESRSAVLPLIKMLPPDKAGGEVRKQIRMIGAGIFKKDKLVGTIDESETRGLMWLRDEIQVTTVTIETGDPNENVSLNPIRETTSLKPQIKDGKRMMLVNVSLEGDIVQNGTKLNLMDRNVIKKLEGSLENDIRVRIEEALQHVQKEWKVDVFNFAKQFHRQYPKQWQQMKENWNDILPQVEVTTKVEAHIRRPGNISRPAGVPKDKGTEE